MPHWTRDVGDWFAAVVHHWEVIVITGAIPFGIHLVDRLFKWKMPKKLYSVFVGIGLVLAIFAAWRDEHTSAEWRGQEIVRLNNQLIAEREQNTPKLTGEIYAIMAAPSMGHDAIVTLFGSISNVGAASTAKDINVYVKIPGGQEIEGDPLPAPLGLVKLNQKEGGSGILVPQEYLPSICIDHPIPKGGSASGWMMVLVKGLTNRQILAAGTNVSMTFKDFTGKVGRIEHVSDDKLSKPIDMCKLQHH